MRIRIRDTVPDEESWVGGIGEGGSASNLADTDSTHQVGHSYIWLICRYISYKQIQRCEENKWKLAQFMSTYHSLTKGIFLKATLV